MIDTKQLLDKFMGSGMAGGLAGGLAGGALTGLLANKKGREIAGSALKIGGVALAGGLAYKAYQNYRNRQSITTGQPAAARVAQQGASEIDKNAFIPPNKDVEAQQSLGLLLLKAMINAAKADGNIDTHESSKIFAEINRLGLGAEEKALLMEEYARPVDLSSLVAEVKTPEQAVEVYAVSVMVIDEQNPQETHYLQNLASTLGLDPALVEEIHQTVADNLAETNRNSQVA
jgi:uncharacterized membrane protein YebE (DUF533 family)